MRICLGDRRSQAPVLRTAQNCKPARRIEIPGLLEGTADPDYAAYDYDYEDYPEQGGRNWALVGMGCLLVAIIVILLLAIYVYFFAPASIVDPIIDFLAGFGVNVP